MSAIVTRIMYIECKSGGLEGPARIGRVSYSKSGRTARYAGQRYIPIKGFKANYLNPETGDEYWISGPKKGGGDRLYGTGRVEIDEDVRDEYWSKIRGMPERAGQTDYRD